MTVKLRWPRLGLYSRFLLLFSLTAVLLAGLITLGSFTYSESEMKTLIAEKHDQIYETVTEFAGQDIDIEEIRDRVDGPRVELKIVRNTQSWTTWDDFPEFDTLMASAEKIQSLYLVKYRFRYYLLATRGDTQVAATAQVVNLLVYPDWLVYWPWLSALGILALSYQILRHWLRPIADSLESAQRVSQGDFSYRISHHPKTELADLTRGLNAMTAELQQIFDAKNELLLAISHELRTPLARMKVSLALLGNHSATADLDRDVKYMDELIEQLLEGERLEQGHKVLHITSHYLPSLIEDVIAELASDDRIAIVGGIPEAAIDVDVGRFKFLLRNLLSNALTHSPPASAVTMSIDENEHGFAFHVTDTGKGIPPASLEQIFAPFYRVEHIDNRSAQGVGLGLYLCRKIALAHQGSLSVESELGKGSCFTVTLPK